MPPFFYNIFIHYTTIFFIIQFYFIFYNSIFIFSTKHPIFHYLKNRMFIFFLWKITTFLNYFCNFSRTIAHFQSKQVNGHFIHKYILFKHYKERSKTNELRNYKSKLSQGTHGGAVMVSIYPFWQGYSHSR